MPHISPDPQLVIRGPETTENIPAARRVRDVDKKLRYLDPDVAPLTQILTRARSRVATSPKFEWMEKDLAARWDQLNDATDMNSSDTAMVVDHGEYFSVGDIVNVVATGEKVRVTAVDTATETLTIVRSVGTTAAGNILNNGDLQIIGNAYAENATSGVEKSHQETNPYNYTQIVRTPLGTSRTLEKSDTYTGAPRPLLRAEKGIEHKIDLERTALFGERDIDASNTSAPIRYTGGVLFFGTSNIKDFGGTMTESELELWTEDVFHHSAGGGSRILLASPRALSIINQLVAGRIQTVSGKQTYGLRVTQWLTAHGEFNIVRHPLLENGPGGTGYGNYMLALDPSRMTFRFLRDSNTKLKMDIQANDLDGWKDEYLTEAGWQFENPRLHGVAKNITG